MSRASKFTLAGTSLFALATIVVVHFQQKWEQAAMHEGVIRDLEHQRLKRERQQDFELQQALEAQYRREGQNVVPSPLDDPPPISRTGLADKEKSKG